MVGGNGRSFWTLSKMIKGKISASFLESLYIWTRWNKTFPGLWCLWDSSKKLKRFERWEVEAKTWTGNFCKTGAKCRVLEEVASASCGSRTFTVLANSTSPAALPTSCSQGAGWLQEGWRGQNSNSFEIFSFPISFKNTARCSLSLLIMNG